MMIDSECIGYCPPDENLETMDLFYFNKVDIYVEAWEKQLNRTFPGEFFKFEIDPFLEVDESFPPEVYIVWDSDVPKSVQASKYVLSDIPKRWDNIARVFIKDELDKLDTLIEEGLQPKYEDR